MSSCRWSPLPNRIGTRTAAAPAEIELAGNVEAPTETVAAGNVELPLDRPGDPEELSDALAVEPSEPDAAKPIASGETDALDLAPPADELAPETFATTNTELPLEPAELPTASADDTLATEGPLPVDDEPIDSGVLDLGSASTFDLPLELDLAETPQEAHATINVEPPSEVDEEPADVGVLDLGPTSTFDLPLELDVADAPPIPKAKSMS